MSKSIIVALDEHKQTKFEQVLDQLNPDLCMVKIGSVSFNSLGREAIIKAASKGFDIFLDLKLHDIPNTVYKALKNLLNEKLWMTNIHLLGGEEMIQAAREAREHVRSEALLIGVTVLTSLDVDHIKNMGFSIQISELVNILSKSAKRNNIDGVVCSAKEVPEIKGNLGQDFIAVTPGIRVQQNNDDQSRVATLKEAIRNGSDYIVLGREITASENISKMIKKVESYII